MSRQYASPFKSFVNNKLQNQLLPALTSQILQWLVLNWIKEGGMATEEQAFLPMVLGTPF